MKKTYKPDSERWDYSEDEPDRDPTPMLGCIAVIALLLFASAIVVSVIY